ncbi:hypothetical protein NDI52_32500 [Leptolyngbya sp. PL-A3]|uniref:WapI family immunity protein n=1 Tax=Leptolyngbya sp. PL-A3 TaxID=2933911 RepID=UPI0032997DC1
MASFRISGDDSEYLSVKVAGRSHAAQDYWDGNWLNADIEIDAGAFRGRYGAYLRAEELLSFRDAITRLYSFDSKEARFETMERQLSINIAGDSLGHFTAKCEAVDQAGIGNRLSFSLSFDQTEIPAMLKGLDAIVREYPVIGKPDI